jgi:hypothetical protein
MTIVPEWFIIHFKNASETRSGKIQISGTKKITIIFSGYVLVSTLLSSLVYKKIESCPKIFMMSIELC